METACEVCGAREALVSLVDRGGSGDRWVGKRLCGACWTAEAPVLEPLARSLGWVVEVRDPAVTGVTPEGVACLLALERAGAPEAALADAAEGLVHFVIQSRRRLPPELEGFVRRHRRPAV